MSERDWTDEQARGFGLSWLEVGELTPGMRLLDAKTDLFAAVARYSRAHRWAGPGDPAQSDPEWLRAHGLALILSTSLHGSVMLAHTIGGEHRDALAVEADRLTLAGDWRGEMIHRWLAGRLDEADLARRLLDGVEACSMCRGAGNFLLPHPWTSAPCPKCDGRGARLTTDPGLPPLLDRVRAAVDVGAGCLPLDEQDVPYGFQRFVWPDSPDKAQGFSWPPPTTAALRSIAYEAPIREFQWSVRGDPYWGRAIVFRDEHGRSLVERR